MPQDTRDAELLIEFLNFKPTDTASMRLESGEFVLSMPPIWSVLFGHRVKGSRQLPKLLKEIDRTQTEMKKDLAGLYGDNPEPHLDRLIKKIDQMNLHARYALIRVEESWPKEERPSAVVAHRGAVFQLGGRPFSVVFDRLQLDVTLEKEWYLVLATVLERGDIEKVGRCSHCERYFLRKDVRAVFCSTTCRYRHSNQERRKAGYFKKWYKSQKG